MIRIPITENKEVVVLFNYEKVPLQGKTISKQRQTLLKLLLQNYVGPDKLDEAVSVLSSIPSKGRLPNIHNVNKKTNEKKERSPSEILSDLEETKLTDKATCSIYLGNIQEKVNLEDMELLATGECLRWQHDTPNKSKAKFEAFQDAIRQVPKNGNPKASKLFKLTIGREVVKTLRLKFVDDKDKFYPEKELMEAQQEFKASL